MALPSIRLRSVPLFSLALLEVVPSPLLLPTTYESCIHEDSVATVEAGSQKQIGIRWPDQETQETQGFFSFCGRRRWRRQRFRRTQGLFSFSVGGGDGEQGPPVPAVVPCNSCSRRGSRLRRRISLQYPPCAYYLEHTA